MKFSHLVDYNKINIVPKNYAGNEARRLVLDYFLFLKQAL